MRDRERAGEIGASLSIFRVPDTTKASEAPMAKRQPCHAKKNIGMSLEQNSARPKPEANGAENYGP